MPRIGHASISEHGTVNGTKGDQTTREVCIREWYSYPWDYMAIHPNPAVREKHARAIEQACANDNIGYGQNDRNSLYTQARYKNFDLSAVGLCNCDCSSLQNVAAVASGSGAEYAANGWCTFNMRVALKALGYIIVTDKKFLASADYCIRGAIYVSEQHHTAAGLDNGPKAADVLRAVGAGNASGTAATKPTAAATPSAPKQTAASPAQPKLEPTSLPPDDDLRGAWKTTAILNLRAGAGTEKPLVYVMPKGATVRCYGYYNRAEGKRWLCVQYKDGDTLWTGYCSEKYLER